MEILKWEYKNLHRFREEEKIATFGKAGWEAVGIERDIILFKRPCGMLQMKEVSPENKKKASK